jgi:hypothetical protein
MSLQRSTLALFCLVCLALPAPALAVTQHDWMVTLVESLGWSYGLPDEPQDPDYSNILLGNRTLQLEAEDAFRKGEDNVSEMSFRNFGAFSGRGWLNCGREASDVHLTFTLPLAGNYRVTARIRNGQSRFSIGDREATATAGARFSEVTLGRFSLAAGEQTITVTLPPGGSIDTLTLKAPNLAPISPWHGWQPAEELSSAALQTTLVQLFGLTDALPSASEPQRIEAEELPQRAVRVVDTPHLGRPSGGKWLRSISGAGFRLPLQVTADGFYDLQLRLLGRPVGLIIAGQQQFSLAGKPYLDELTVAGLSLAAGNHELKFTLPPGGGFDRLDLVARQSTPASLATLLDRAAGSAPTPAEIDRYAALLATFGSIR